MGIFDLGSGAVKGAEVRGPGIAAPVVPGKALALLLRKVATTEALVVS
jgi:hypothetical protein